LLGIYEDTGCFLYGCTSMEDFQAASFLRPIADMKIIYDIMRDKLELSTKTKEILGKWNENEYNVLRQLLNMAKIYSINETQIIITESVSSEMVSIAPMINTLLENNDSVEAVFGLHIVEDRIFIVGRSKYNSSVNVGKICQYFGGGGHSNAASASIKDITSSQIKDQLYLHLLTELNNPILVQDVMVKRVIFIESDKTVQEAFLNFQSKSLKKIPVIDSKTKECVGILDKFTTEVAIKHELKEENIDFLMETDFVTVFPDSKLETAIELIIRKGQRLIPVLESTKMHLVGVISRSDVIDILLKEPSRFPKKQSENKAISQDIFKKLSPLARKIIKTLIDIADKLEINIYASGEFARSILVNEFCFQNVEIVLESNFENFTKELEGKCDFEYFQKNNRITITQDEFTISIISVEMDNYPFSTNFPMIELSSLKMTLYSSDFTVDSIAIQLNHYSFGNIIDFFNGINDLKSKKMQVLHNMSFIEKPTRIFKAVTMEQHGFEIAKHTERLMKYAINVGVIEKLNGKEIIVELEKIANEKNFASILTRLHVGFKLWTHILKLFFS